MASTSSTGPRVTKSRWGYFVWVVALATVFIPEILAAWGPTKRHLPFTTISGMVGHLEWLAPIVEVATTALIVFALFSILRLPPKTTSGGHAQPAAVGGVPIVPAATPHRTAGGRTTFRHTPATTKTAASFDLEPAPHWFIIASLLSFALIAGATVATRVWWPDPKPKPGETSALFNAGYVLYGLIATLWIVAPSLYSFIQGKDAPFPTLFRSLSNLENWLTKRKWPGSLGPSLAWCLSYVVVWGLVFLLIHLTLYPFPSITNMLNPTGK